MNIVAIAQLCTAIATLLFAVAAFISSLRNGLKADVNKQGIDEIKTTTNGMIAQHVEAAREAAFLKGAAVALAKDKLVIATTPMADE